MSDLRIKTARGSIWIAGLQIGIRPLILVFDVILLRLLLPEDYGLFALAAILISTANLFTNLGMSQVVIQTRQDINKVATYSFFIVMIGSIAATALIIIFAQPFAKFLGGTEDLIPVLRSMAIYIVIEGLLLIPDAILRRNLQFKQVALSQTTGEISRGLIAIPLAMMGFGVWSLVFGMLLAKTIETTMYWYFRRPWIWLRPQPIERGIVTQMVRFGIPVTLSGFLSFFQGSVDTWYVGRQLNQTAVGYYNRAFSFTARINNMVTTALFGQVLFPSYSVMQDDRPRLARAYLKSVNLVYLMVVPISLGMAVTAPILVKVLIGEKWLPMVPVWQIFSLYGLTQPISANASPIFLALGKPRNNVMASFVLLAVLLPSLVLLTARLGMVGAALAVSLAHFVGMLFNVWLVELELKGTAARTFVQSLPFLLAGGLMSLAILMLQETIFSLAGGQNIISLITIIVLGALVYISVILLLRRELLVEVLELFIKAVGIDRRWPKLVPRSMRIEK